MNHQLGIAVFMALILGLAACQQAAGAAVDAGEVITQELAVKYGATTGWEQEFDYTAFTFEIQGRLVTGTPVAFRAWVDDIFFRDRVMVIRLSSSYPSEFIWELDCDRTVVAKVLSANTTDSRWGEYAVVANIETVSKAVVGLREVYSSEGEESYRDIEFYQPDLWTAKGSCVDIAYIPWR